jgi:hypothetical protein
LTVALANRDGLRTVDPLTGGEIIGEKLETTRHHHSLLPAGEADVREYHLRSEQPDLEHDSAYNLFSAWPTIVRRTRPGFCPWAYLQRLQEDGVSRLDRWLSAYLGAPETEYSRAVGSRWLISALAQTFRSGGQGGLLSDPRRSAKHSEIHRTAHALRDETGGPRFWPVTCGG